MSLSITPGTNNVGAYINSVDLKNLDQNQTIELKKTLNEFGVILLKNKILILNLIKILPRILGNPLFILD